MEPFGAPGFSTPLFCTPLDGQGFQAALEVRPQVLHFPCLLNMLQTAQQFAENRLHLGPGQMCAKAKMNADPIAHKITSRNFQQHLWIQA